MIEVHRQDLSQTGLDHIKVVDGDTTLVVVHSGLKRGELFSLCLQIMTIEEINDALWVGPYCQPSIALVPTVPAQRPSGVAVSA